MAIKEITKTEALALLNDQKATEILQPALNESVALQVFPHVQMSKRDLSMPVLATLPEAKWVEDSSGPTGKKPTSNVSWETKTLTAAELAVIVPIHENILADTDIDVWGQIQPLVTQAFAAKLDAAVFFGIDKPAAWTSHTGIVPAAKTAKNTVADGTGADLADDLNAAFGMVEDDGFDVNFAVTAKSVRSRLRGLRSATGEPIYLDALRSDRDTSKIFGQDLYYAPATGWDPAQALAVVGDRNRGIIGIREDMQVKFLDQATIDGVSLAEHDMVAMRFKFRVAFATAFSTAGAKKPAEVYPFAAVTPKA